MKRKILSALLALCFILTALVGCNGDGPEPEPQPTGPAEYTVSVKSEYGLPLAGVFLIIHDNASPNPSSSVARLVTDREGKASATLEQGKDYSVVILESPEGYRPEASYPFDGRNAEVRIASAPADIANIDGVDEYSLGDVVHNITLTGVDGVKRSVAEALEENELLILNFWFAGCGPCRSEFPHFISLYGEYRDKGVEIFGVNDNGEPIGTVRDFKVTVDGVATALPFPTFKADSAENGYSRCELISKFGSTGYPTTVFIDRAGVICYIHIGVLSETGMKTLIEHFTAEDYEQRLGQAIWNN